jgi:hypothetical protein
MVGDTESGIVSRISVLWFSIVNRWVMQIKDSDVCFNQLPKHGVYKDVSSGCWGDIYPDRTGYG